MSAVLSPSAPKTVARRKPVLLHPAAKPLLFLVCLLPFAWLLYAAIADQLGEIGRASCRERVCVPV